jgi:hypothetical protein
MGNLNAKEIYQVIENPTKVSLKKIYDKYDTDKNGYIDDEEYKKLGLLFYQRSEDLNKTEFELINFYKKISSYSEIMKEKKNEKLTLDILYSFLIDEKVKRRKVELDLIGFTQNLENQIIKDDKVHKEIIKKLQVMDEEGVEMLFQKYELAFFIEIEYEPFSKFLKEYAGKLSYTQNTLKKLIIKMSDFNVLDVNSDGKLEREDFFHFFKKHKEEEEKIKKEEEDFLNYTKEVEENMTKSNKKIMNIILSPDIEIERINELFDNKENMKYDEKSYKTLSKVFLEYAERMEGKDIEEYQLLKEFFIRLSTFSEGNIKSKNS